MIVAPFSEVPADQWDTAVNSSPDGWPFALSSWRRVILSISEWKLQDHSFALKGEGRLVAIVPLQLDLRSAILGMTGWGGCGPIIVGDLSDRDRKAAVSLALENVGRIASETDAVALRFSVSPVTRSSIDNTRGVNPFAFHGLEDLSGVAQVIDLSPTEDELWGALSETARQTVRKAEKAGVAIERADWPTMLDAYYRVHVENYQRTGVTPHPKSYFAGIASEIGSAGHSVLWVARSASGDPIAFHNAMHFGVGAWYHTGCSTAAALTCGANYLLFWQSLLGAKARGLRWYDCGEIFPHSGGEKTDGLTLFKTRFGGTPHRFLKAGKTYRAEVNTRSGPIERARKLARRLVGAPREP